MTLNQWLDKNHKEGTYDEAIGFFSNGEEITLWFPEYYMAEISAVKSFDGITALIELNLEEKGK